MIGGHQLLDRGPVAGCEGIVESFGCRIHRRFVDIRRLGEIWTKSEKDEKRQQGCDLTHLPAPFLR